MTKIAFSVALLIAFGLIVFAFLAYSPKLHFSVAMIALAIILGVPAVVDEAVLMAKNKMKITAIITASESALRTIGCLLCIALEFGLEWIFAVFALSRLCASIGYMFFIRQWYSKVSFATITSLLKKAPPYLGIIVFGACMLRLDNTFLSLCRTMEDVGIYSAAYKLFEMILSVVIIAIMAIFPTVARNFVLHEESRLQFSRAFSLVLLAGIPVVFLLASFSNTFIHMVYSSRFSSSGPVLALLSITLLFYSLDRIFSLIVHSAKKPQLDTNALGFGTVVFVGALFVLVPRYGVLGAAGASAVAHLILVCFRFFQIKHSIGWGGFLKESRTIFMCGAIASVPFVLYLWKEKTVLALCSSLGVYFGALLIVKESHVHDGLKKIGERIKNKMGITG